MMTPTAALNYLALRKRKLDLYTQEEKEDTRYGFMLGAMRFLLRPQEKVEAIKAVPACPMPNTPPWFTGIINLRGNLLPVFDIKQLLDMKSPELPEWIIVFGQDKHATGIYADTMPSGVTIERPADVKPLLHEFLQDCVENTLMQGDNMWVEVAFDKMFENLRTRF